VGYRLYEPADSEPRLPIALEAALPKPEPWWPR
jgi:hypothetical protein